MNGQNFQLTVTRGPEPGKVISLSTVSMTIGRDPMSEITINDPEVSRRHATLLGTLTGYDIQDLGSTNGTFVDGIRLGGEPVALEPGQVITIGGGVELVYQAVMEVDTQAETVLEGDIELSELPQPPQPSQENIKPGESSEPFAPSEEEAAVEEYASSDAFQPEEDDAPPPSSAIAAEDESEAAQLFEWAPPVVGDEKAFEEATAFEDNPSQEPEAASSYDADDFAKPVVIPHEGEEEISEVESPPFHRRLGTIIAAVLLLILCCCCGFLVFFYYIGGDWLLRQMGMQ